MKALDSTRGKCKCFFLNHLQAESGWLLYFCLYLVDFVFVFFQTTCRPSHYLVDLTRTQRETPTMMTARRAGGKAGKGECDIVHFIQHRHHHHQGRWWSSPSSPVMEVVKRILKTMSILRLAPKLSLLCASNPTGLKSLAWKWVGIISLSHLNET